jgi:hypothetical protein
MLCALRDSIHRILPIFALLVLAACAQTKAFVHDSTPKRPAGTVQIVLLEPDIELSELTAGGLSEPNAEWTRRARSNVNIALDQIMERSRATLVRYETGDDASEDEGLTQLIKLHEAVGNTILLHKYNEALALPTKKNKFDWSLGPDVRQLREFYDADYALFVYFRDSFASAGRVAMMVVGAVFGVGVQGGVQVGFASLVDLNSGDVIWFNRLVSGAGDLREPNAALSATEDLLDEFPL